MSKDWINFGKPWNEFNEGYPNKDRSVPGVQIEMADGTRYLIGDINQLRGVCDDCNAFDRDEVVARYRYLLTEEDLGA